MTNTLKSALLAATLVLGMADPALARPPRHDPYAHAPRHHAPYRHHRNWEGVAAALVVTGLIGAAIANSAPPPAPVYAVPDPNYPQVWYFCESSRLYYPEVRHCPEGWRIVR